MLKTNSGDCNLWRVGSWCSQVWPGHAGAYVVYFFHGCLGGMRVSRAIKLDTNQKQLWENENQKMQPEQSTMSRSLATTKRNNLVGATAVVGNTDITIGALTSRRASLLDKFCCDQRSSFSVDCPTWNPNLPAASWQWVFFSCQMLTTILLHRCGAPKTKLHSNPVRVWSKFLPQGNREKLNQTQILFSKSLSNHKLTSTPLWQGALESSRSQTGRVSWPGQSVPWGVSRMSWPSLPACPKQIILEARALAIGLDCEPKAHPRRQVVVPRAARNYQRHYEGGWQRPANQTRQPSGWKKNAWSSRASLLILNYRPCCVAAARRVRLV